MLIPLILTVGTLSKPHGRFCVVVTIICVICTITGQLYINTNGDKVIRRHTHAHICGWLTMCGKQIGDNASQHDDSYLMNMGLMTRNNMKHQYEQFENSILQENQQCYKSNQAANRHTTHRVHSWTHSEKISYYNSQT